MGIAIDKIAIVDLQIHISGDRLDAVQMQVASGLLQIDVIDGIGRTSPLTTPLFIHRDCEDVPIPP
jgi:hypothetical protein